MKKLPIIKYPVIFQTSHDIPAELMPWLMAGGSLTAQFEALAGQPLRVKPVFEGYRCVTQFTSQDLQLPRPQMAWVREVELYGSDEQPWATAQSIFPISALRGSARRLRHLGKTPLGYVLFGRHKPECQRVIVDGQLDDAANGDICFTRQNYYHWHGHDILVQETFLPAFADKLAQLNVQ